MVYTLYIIHVSCILYTDRRSAINLELINNTHNGDQKHSLYATINHTSTLIGTLYYGMYMNAYLYYFIRVITTYCTKGRVRMSVTLPTYTLL